MKSCFNPSPVLNAHGGLSTSASRWESRTLPSARFLARHPGGINIPASVSTFSTDAACTPVWHSWPPGYCAPGPLVRHTHRRDAASADREPALQVLIPARESVTGCAKPLFTCKLGARSPPLFSLCLKCPHTRSPFTRNTPVVSSSHTVRGAQRARTLGTACLLIPAQGNQPRLGVHTHC